MVIPLCLQRPHQPALSGACLADQAWAAAACCYDCLPIAERGHAPSHIAPRSSSCPRPMSTAPAAGCSEGAADPELCAGSCAAGGPGLERQCPGREGRQGLCLCAHSSGAVLHVPAWLSPPACKHTLGQRSQQHHIRRMAAGRLGLAGSTCPTCDSCGRACGQHACRYVLTGNMAACSPPEASACTSIQMRAARCQLSAACPACHWSPDTQPS